MGLSVMQEKFCQEYVIDLNGAAAARRAGYSENSSNSRAAQLLASPAIHSRVVELKREQVEARKSERAKSRKSADDVMDELEKGAFVDPGLMFDAAGNFIPIPSMPEHVRRAIDRFQVQESTRVEMGENGNPVQITTKTMTCVLSKSKDKEMLAKHHKLLTDRVELGFDESLASQLEDAVRRVEGLK